ncbi:unnamed protein product [Rotaria sordida]|uniref:A-kinase anchor protein 7-like phosphoesterase domain-containing protein n=1 Tax=Rotaria sordida TaxID=392033 RepID=A0A814LZT3_9BILA|nr:unnamed protein product [Rotaria sordida]
MKLSAKKDKQQKERPNAFLAFRIMNQQIVHHAAEIQKEIIQSNPLLSQASVSIAKLHITLMVFELKNDEDKQRAQQCLIKACHRIRMAQLVPPQIRFAGLSNFNDRVLFMNPVNDAHLDVLKQIATICRETFEENGILRLDNRPLHPHLTLFQLKQGSVYEGMTKIDSSLYTKFADKQFGTEIMRSLQLCNMKRTRADGYYEVFLEESPFCSQ